MTLDLIKQLESEVLRRLEDMTGQAQLRLDIAQVNPSQFLGIEINPRAAAIADLVIWIGYLPVALQTVWQHSSRRACVARVQKH